MVQITRREVLCPSYLGFHGACLLRFLRQRLLYAQHGVAAKNRGVHKRGEGGLTRSVHGGGHDHEHHVDVRAGVEQVRPALHGLPGGGVHGTHHELERSDAQDDEQNEQDERHDKADHRHGHGKAQANGDVRHARDDRQIEQVAQAQDPGEDAELAARGAQPLGDGGVLGEHAHEHHDHEESYGCGHEHHDHHEDDHEKHDHHDHDHEHHEHHYDENGVCSCGHHHDHDGHHHHADDVFTSWGRETPRKYTKTEIESILKTLSDDEFYGTILRAKGMVENVDSGWIYFDMVPGEYELREGEPDYTGRLCVIGCDLKEDELERLFLLS